MFYRLLFFICFILVTLICALYMLSHDKVDENFIKLILVSFGIAFAVSLVLVGMLKLLVHAFRWLTNANNYREKYEMRK